MIKSYKSLLASVLVLGLAGFGSATSASAAPAAGLKSMNSAAAQEANSNLIKVGRRHHRAHGHRHRGWRGHRGWQRHSFRHRHHRHHRRHWGRTAAIVGGVVAGAAIANAHRGGSYSAIERCEARFRSFDRRTGTYTTYGGETRLCPYLR